MRLFLTVLMVLLAFGCKTPENAKTNEKELIPIEIVFSSDEAIKRVPYKLSNITMSLTNALNGVERGYSATILVNPDHLDSILEKVGLEEGVTRISQTAH